MNQQCSSTCESIGSNISGFDSKRQSFEPKVIDQSNLEELGNEKSILMKARLDKVKRAIDSYREYKSDISFTLNSSNNSRMTS